MGWLKEWWEGKPVSKHNLTDITRGMQHAASTTTAMLGQQFILLINQYFDKDKDGTLRAKMVQVELSPSHFVKVPLISLVQPSAIVLKKLRIRMSVRIEEAEIKDAQRDIMGNSEATRLSFKVSMSPRTSILGRRSDVTDVEMVFEGTDAPEGIMRLIEQHTNLIEPLKKDGGGQ